MAFNRTTERWERSADYETQVERDSCRDSNKGTFWAEGSALSTVFWFLGWMGARPQFAKTHRVAAAGFNLDPSSGCSQVHASQDRRRHYSR